MAGFAIGAVLGLAVGRYSAHVPHGQHAQRLYGALTCGLLSLAWPYAA
jgi:hypothetical protein